MRRGNKKKTATLKKKLLPHLSKKPLPKHLPSLTISQKKKVKYKTAPLLSHEQRRQVIGWLVDRHSPTQVAKLVKQEFGITLTRNAIWAYAHSRKWQPVINRLQAAVERNLIKIPIANKSYQLLGLQAILRESLTWRLTNVTQTGKKIYKLNVSAAVRAIAEAHAIMEPAKTASEQPKEGDFHLHLTVAQKEKKRARITSFIRENKGLIDVLLGPRDS